MQPEYFLFGIGMAWVAIATIQDIKMREVANWITFSLIASALAYRAFFASFYNDLSYFIIGLIGLAIFIGLAHAFYYGRVFAGGDAKLLMGVGATLPYTNFFSLVIWGLGFLLLLALAGAVYTIGYSLILAYPERNKVKRKAIKVLKEVRKLFILTSILSIIFIFAAESWILWIAGSIFIFLVPFLHAYLQAVDEICMRKLTNPKDLREGDWLTGNLKARNKVILARVHGLSIDDIKLIRKAGKKVVIKTGIPFVPAFLIAYILLVMVFFLGNGKFSFLSELFALF
ncbi:prepilin peptidase [Candidatus Pacearchaeota archaeon]|nr:prepilin peptidase [Candidatus Pacearchaeota archaeon]